MWTTALLVLAGGTLLRAAAPVPDPGPDAAACAPLARLAATAPATAADVWEALRVHNGAVRWDVARGPVRLWVQPRDVATTTHDRPDALWRAAVVDAAGDWRGVVPGLAFAPVRDSSAADVVVTWAGRLGDDAGDALAMQSAGRTTLVPATDGRAVAAQVQLAVAAPTGQRYTVDDVRAVARHELGHVLGLAHHAAPRSVMAPLVTAERLDVTDREALRVLYALPVGARCGR
jgi:hypothetical protein